MSLYFRHSTTGTVTALDAVAEARYLSLPAESRERLSTLDTWQLQSLDMPDTADADSVNKLRVYRSRPAEGWSYYWTVDGYNTLTLQSSMWAHSYTSFEAALADLPNVWQTYIIDPLSACSDDTGHLPTADHRWQECPTYIDSEED